MVVGGEQAPYCGTACRPCMKLSRHDSRRTRLDPLSHSPPYLLARAPSVIPDLQHREGLLALSVAR